MSRMQLLVGLMVLASGTSCSNHYDPTILPTPANAQKIHQRFLLGGNAYQTDFILEVKYPSMVALDHYSNSIGRPWYYCAWGSGDWESYLDSTGFDSKGKTTRTVHHKLHMWVNLKAKRSLALILSYYSDPLPDFKQRITPDNDSQQVILVEYFGVDISDEIKRLKLRCPPEVYAAL